VSAFGLTIANDSPFNYSKNRTCLNDRPGQRAVMESSLTGPVRVTYADVNHSQRKDLY
jgi:hypothetical protein